jgi:glycosyltransferase involved in cell wall biosynthesis
MEDRRIRLFRQKNQGPSAARNKGIAEAHADLVAFLDADDEWKPSFLESILRLQARYPDAGACAAAYEIREPDGCVWVPSFPEMPPAPWEGIIPSFFRSAIRASPVWTSAVVIRREVFDTVGRFVLCPGVAQDADLWGRIALRYPIAFTWRIGAVYHKEAENRRWGFLVTHVFASDNFERAMRSPGVPSHILPDAAEFLADERLAAASAYVLAGQSRAARAILRKCRTRRFLRRKLWWWFWAALPSGLVHVAWLTKRWLRRGLMTLSRKPCPHRRLGSVSAASAGGVETPAVETVP